MKQVPDSLLAFQHMFVPVDFECVYRCKKFVLSNLIKSCSVIKVFFVDLHERLLLATSETFTLANVRSLPWRSLQDQRTKQELIWRRRASLRGGCVQWTDIQCKQRVRGAGT